MQTAAITRNIEARLRELRSERATLERARAALTARDRRRAAGRKGAAARWGTKR